MILPIFLTHFDIPARKWKESKFTWLGFSSYDMLIVKQVLHLAVNGLSKQTDDETSSLSKYQFSKSGMSLSRQTDNSPQLFWKFSNKNACIEY